MNTTPIDEIKVLDHGIVALMRLDGDDETPAMAARKSYRKDASDYTVAQNLALSDHLVRNKHTTPLEFVEGVWYMEMPMFVARQWVRHRTASIDEESLRYVDARDQFYVPQVSRLQKQSTTNKQGSAPELIDDAEYYQGVMRESCVLSYQAYTKLLGSGMAKELARTVLPLSTYTGWFWKCDLHNTFHLLRLRLDPHAQYEIRVYAEAMHQILKKQVPGLVASFENHVLNAVTFSDDERQVLRDCLRLMQGEGKGPEELISDVWLADDGIKGSRVAEFRKKLGRLLRA